MYGLSVIASVESLQGKKATPPSSPVAPEPAHRPSNRVLAMKAGAIAALLLALPAIDTIA